MCIFCVGVLIWMFCGCCGDLSVWVCGFDSGGFSELAVLWVSLAYLTLGWGLVVLLGFLICFGGLVVGFMFWRRCAG